MGIEIYARWRGQTVAGRDAQEMEEDQADFRRVGYLFEAYHGEPYATRHLFAEAFEHRDGEAQIPAETLRERLPKTLELVAERERELYDATEERIKRCQKRFSDFVALCDKKEAETGEPVLIIASY